MPLYRVVTFVLLAAGSIASGADRTADRGAVSQDRVPRAVELAARHGTIEQFANAAAAARIPMGVVIAAEDNRRPKTWRPSPDEPEGPPADLAEAVALFETSNPRYVARHSDGVLRIRPAAETPCVRVVERTFEGVTASGRAFEVVYHAVRARNRDHSPAPPPGIVGGGVSRDDSSPDPYLTFVSVDLHDVSLADVLDAIVKDVPRLGWAVRELRMPPPGRDNNGSESARETRCNVVLFDSESWTDSAMYIIGGAATDRKDDTGPR